MGLLECLNKIGLPDVGVQEKIDALVKSGKTLPEAEAKVKMDFIQKEFDLASYSLNNLKKELKLPLLKPTKITALDFDAINKEYESSITPVVSLKTQPVEAVQEVTVQPIEVIEEQFEPITASDVKVDLFKKDNATDYQEDERESDNGRTIKYLSSITIDALNADGDTIGSVTKRVDEDGTLSFDVEDTDGNMVSKEDGFATLGEAKKALADYYNKAKKKEFAKEAKEKAKVAEKEAAKAAKAKAKAEAKAEAKKPTQPVIAETIDDLLDLDVTDKDNLDKVFGLLDNADKGIGKILKSGANEAMLAIPLNVVRVAIKTLKALVQGGMILRDAIKKVAADNNISQESIRDIINIAPVQDSFYSLMDRVDALIAKQKARGIEDSKIASNIDTFIRKQSEYLNANDAQKKIIEREARGKVGAAPKRAVSIGRVLGALQDITNISRAEKLKIISQIRTLSRDAAKDLAKEIREMSSSGKITAVQAANIISRFGKVNMLNEISVSNFVDYMAKVFANAEYANKIDVANSKLKNARKNIATKIGISDGLMLPLQKLFSINPSLIPDAYLDRYLELVDMFGEKKAVLSLDKKSIVKNDVDAILNEINNEQSKTDELSERFNNSENKVFKDGVLDYSASIKKMIEEGEINETEADIMRKYKADILPEVKSSTLSEEEIIKKKKEYISALKDSAIDGSELPTRDEKNLANRLAKLIRTMPVEDLMKLSIIDLKNLLKLINNVNNNYLPHYAQIMVEKLNGIKYGKILAEAIKKAKLLKFSTLYARFKNLFTKKGVILEAVRRIPLYNIDQLLGDFKTKDVFNALFEKTSEAEASFKSALKSIQNKLEKAESKVAKSFNLNPDKTLISKFKMMTYMIQLEYNSNKGSEQVNPAADYLKATIKHISNGKSRFGERDAKMLQDILDSYSTNGNIDIDALYSSFNQAEKDAIKDIREINESLKDTAQYTASIIRGDAIDPLNNYVHLNVLQDGQRGELNAATDFLNQANNSRTPSTKAKSLIGRTKGAKPLNFDVFASAQRGSKFVLLDYHLTEPIRTARRTINEAANILDSTVGLTKTQKGIKNAIENAFEEAVDNLLTNSILQNSWVDEAIDFISKQGYRAVLAGTGRFAAELTSNISFALLSNPKSFIEGVKYRGVIMSELGPSVMKNVKSKQSSRIYPSDTLSGSFVDQNIMNKAGGKQEGASNNAVANKMQQIYNLTLKREQNFVGEAADFLISTPDKIVMRPIWFGTFATEFEKISGKKVDFEKIASNDEAYMNANDDAIQSAKRSADEISVMTGATDNTFMGMLKGRTKPNQSVTTRVFNNFNNYMTNFMIFEFITARTAIYSLVGDGSISKSQGAALLAASVTRMTIYTMLANTLASGVIGLFGFGDDEEEEVKDEKTFMQRLGQSLASTFTSLLIGRDFGNSMKLGINLGIEEFNEEYLDFLREGDYDPYKDKIAYSLLPTDEKNKEEFSKFLIKMTGAFAPVLNTGALIYKNAGGIVPVLSGETTKKEEDAIEREKQTITERIPLEILGNLGYIPLYKEIRKVSNDNIYKSLKKANKEVESFSEIKEKSEKIKDLRQLKEITTNEDELRIINRKIIQVTGTEEQKKLLKESNKRKKERKDRLLYDSENRVRYDNESEMERYNKPLYNQRFGVGSDWYEKTKYEQSVEDKLSKINRKREDIEYQYTTPSKKR